MTTVRLTAAQATVRWLSRQYVETAQGEGTLSGIAVETDDATGLAKSVAAVRLGPHLEETWPRHWD